MCVIYNECLSFITHSHIPQATTMSSLSENLCGDQSHELSQIRVGGATGTRVRFTLKTLPILRL